MMHLKEHINAGGVFLKRHWKKIGCYAVVVGLAFVMALILPPEFWIFASGLLLIVCGIILCRK